MNGVLNVLKPPGMSSGQVVGAVRRLFDTKKVGHTGTLDPGAAGVLPICVERATKLADYIMRGDKEYIAEMTVGAETDTLDSYGTVTQAGGKPIRKDELMELLPRFTGELLQTPPAYSALKQDGVPLYKLARKGITVEKPPRGVTIHRIELLEGETNRFLLRIRCSKGTYIRSLVADMARAAGSYACMTFLLRTETGGFQIEDAFSLDELADMKNRGDALIPMETAVGFLPKVGLPDHLYDAACSGAAIDLARAGIQARADADHTVWCRGEMVCISHAAEGYLKVKTMLKTGGQ